MKKLLAGLLVAGAGLAFGLATWSAWTAQARHRALVDALVGLEDVRLLDASYARGWLRSSAETSVELHGAVGEAFAARLSAAGVPDVRGRVGLHVRERIAHGPLALWQWLREGALGAPVVARVRTRVELDNETKSELAEVFGRPPPLRIETAVRSTGRAEARLRLGPGRFVWRHLSPELREDGASEEGEAAASGPEPPSREELPEPLRVDWRGLAGTATAGDVFGTPGEIAARIELPAIGLARGERVRRLRDLRLDLELGGLGSEAPSLRGTLRMASFELARLSEDGAAEGAPAATRGPSAGTPAAAGEGTAVAAAADEGAEPGEPSEADRAGERLLLVLEGGRLSGRLALGGLLDGTLAAEIGSLRTAGASLGPLRAELDLLGDRAGPGPALQVTVPSLALDTPAGAVRGEGRLRLAEAGGADRPLAERLDGELALEAPARVADWLRVRSPALRRLLDVHAVPVPEGEGVRARLRLVEGSLVPTATTTAQNESQPGR